MVWVFGICLLPLIAWAFADWYSIGLITTFPLALVFLYWQFIPESPRWLLAVGRIKEAEAVLTKIAKTNGTLENFQPGDLKRMLTELKRKQDLVQQHSHQGLWSLFTRRQVAKYTIMLSIVW